MYDKRESKCYVEKAEHETTKTTNTLPVPFQERGKKNDKKTKRRRRRRRRYGTDEIDELVLAYTSP